MKTSLHIIFILIVNICFAQVGINVTDPKEALHIGGENSSITINGLSSANNVNNLGLGNTGLYVNTYGDLVVSAEKPNLSLDLLGTAFIPSTVKIITTTGGLVSASVASGNFTITNNSLCNISYEVSISRVSPTSNYTIALNDGTPKVMYLRLYIDGVEVSRTSTFYTNEDRNGSIASGFLVLSNSFYQNLTSGSHTYQLIGTITGGSYPFAVDYGVSNIIDRLQIIEFN